MKKYPENQLKDLKVDILKEQKTRIQSENV